MGVGYTAEKKTEVLGLGAQIVPPELLTGTEQLSVWGRGGF